MRSILTGWWSWLVAIWAGLLVLAAASAGLGNDDSNVWGWVAFALVVLAFAAADVRALMIRSRAPRVAAWLLVVGVGLPGIGFFWLLFIPTALAIVILVGGVRTGEISFTGAKPAIADGN